MNDLQLVLYHLAIEQNYKNIEKILLKWHFLRSGNEVEIFYSKEELEKMKNKINNLINDMSKKNINVDNFLPKETLLCNWCYYWEECTAKIGINPVKKAD